MSRLISTRCTFVPASALFMPSFDVDEAVDEEEGPEGSAEGSAGVDGTDKARERGKHEATLQECAALLRGPTDERRLVGLLLVTRLLKAEKEETLQVCTTLALSLCVPCRVLHSHARLPLVACAAGCRSCGRRLPGAPAAVRRGRPRRG